MSVSRFMIEPQLLSGSRDVKQRKQSSRRDVVVKTEREREHLLEGVSGRDTALMYGDISIPSHLYLFTLM